MPPLFTLTTDRLRLTWSGPPALSDTTAPEGRLRVRPLRAGTTVDVEIEGRLVAPDAPLRLTEQTAYRLFIESRSEAPVRLRHRDAVVLSGLATGEGGRVQVGPVDFGGQVGRSRFVVAVGGVDEVAFEVDVLPEKVAWADVEAMREDVDGALAGLALEYLRATSSPTRPVTGALPRRASWLVLVRRALPELERALETVVRHPHRDLLREPVWQRAEAVRRPDAAVRRAVMQGRGAGGVERLRSGSPLRTRLPERRARPTLDTPEHRWLRAHLASARRRLLVLHRDEAERPDTKRRRRVRADLADAEVRLTRLHRLGPLAAADASAAPPPPTPRLLTAPGYAEAHAACRTLALGLALAEGPVPHATKSLPLLYEIWCYLALVQAAARVLGTTVPPEAFVRAEHRGLRLLLRRGRRHGVTLEGERVRVRIAYNPRFSARHGLLAQRPDFLLTVERAGRARRYVLDAKYRRDDTAEYVRRYGAPGPPEDALGDLHRYRDAIVEAGPARTVEAAAALYPHRPDPQFGESRLWRSLGRIGVGALPLLPGETRWLEAWLREAL